MATICAGAVAHVHHDNVVISSCKDDYKLTMTDKRPVVVNTTETQYSLESNLAQDISPCTYYGEFISLDQAKCSGGKAQYKNVTPENVFYDDTKVCFFNDRLYKKGQKQTAKFRRTFKDIRYCARIYLSDDYLVRQKTVTVTIPQSWKGYRLVERNFNDHIKVNHALVGTDSVFTYTITNMPAMTDEPAAPPYSAVYPHLVVVGAFANYHELYQWSQEKAHVDTHIDQLPELLATITKGCTTDEAKIGATFTWVQQNIRYVAFEAGESGHRPDRPSEVIRKRFGDCKGMALLLKTLLKAQGFDARLTYIGTTDIPYRMSDLPTLAATNHVICTLFHGGKTYFLDATCNYIPYNYIPNHIQGQQAMVENGADCQLLTVPVLPAETSVDELSYQYRLQNGNTLTGTATYRLCGDMKEYFLDTYNRTEQSDKNAVLANNLNADDHSNNVSEAHWTANLPNQQWAEFTGHIENPHAVQAVDNELYIELNPHNNLFIGKIDTTDRHQDFCLPLACNVVRRVTLNLPAGYRLTHLPPSQSVSTPQGTLTCNFKRQGSQVVFTQRMKIDHRRIDRNDIPRWNEAVSRWTDACNEQLILRK